MRVVVLALIVLSGLLATFTANAATCPGYLFYDTPINASAFWPNLANQGYDALETGVFVDGTYVWYLFNDPFSLAAFDPAVAFSGPDPVSYAAFQNKNLSNALPYYPELDSAQAIIVDTTRDQIIITADTTGTSVQGIFFLRRSTFLAGRNAGVASQIEFVRPAISMTPNVRGLVFDRSGDGSFYASASNNISKFDASGNLVWASTTFSIASFHWGLAIDPDNNILFASVNDGIDLYTYNITSTGLVQNSQLVLGDAIRGVAFDNTFDELYAVKRSDVGLVRFRPYNPGFAFTSFSETWERSNAIALDTTRNWAYVTDTTMGPPGIPHIRIFQYQHAGCQCADGANDCEGAEVCHIGICVTNECTEPCQVGQPDGSCSTSSCVSTSKTDPILYPVQLNFSSASPQFGLIPDGDTGKEMFVLFEELDEILPVGGLPRRNIDLLVQNYVLTGPTETATTQDFNITTVTTSPQVIWYYSLLAANVTKQHPFGSATLSQNGEETKWTFVVKDWPWLATTNKLNLRLRLWSNDGAILSSSSTTNADGTTSFFLHTQNSLLTVTMINFCIVDGSTQSSVNIEFLAENSVLVITFPYFASSLEYDPNFGVLVTPQDSNGSGPDTTLIIVLSVVIPVVVVPILLLIAVLIALYVVWHFKRRSLVHASDSINTDSFEYAAAAVDAED